jgi:hypothetical protein
MLLEKGFDYNNQCFISHSQWDDIFQNIDGMDFYYLMEYKSITLLNIEEFKQILEIIDWHNKTIKSATYNFITAFVDISLELGIEWTIY